MKLSVIGIFNKLGVPIVILGLSLLFFVKLDYGYFFTDEILYLNSGREYILKGDYTLNLQHPFIAKYVVGLASLVNEHNVFILRFPFALMGALSCVTVYLILKDYFGRKLFALAGSVVYSTSFYLFETTRMSMMEPPLHLFWLLFAFFFFKYLKSQSVKQAVFSGIFLGLSIASKFNAVVIIIPSVISLFIYIKTDRLPAKKYLNSIVIAFSAFFSFILTYLPLFAARGFVGVTDIIRSIKDVLLERNSEGKIHVVGDKVYSKSPWWYYFYYIFKNYNLSQKAVYFLSPFALILKHDYFSVFWGVLFLINALLFSLMTLKNPRYIASMELPLVFLVAIFMKYVYEKLNRKIFYFVITALFVSQLLYINNLQKTSYSALFDFLKNRTSDFSKKDRTYILGSIRSSRWYFEGTPEDLVVSRKDFDVMGAEFPNFKYLVVENSEEIKNPNNELSVFIRSSQDKYNLIEFPELKVYERK